jgi:type 1 glutamine amidotransferase
VLDTAVPGRFDKLPPQFAGTKPPTFAAILSLKDAGRFTGMSAEAVATLDPQLRALPVTAADKAARCERYDNEVPRFALAKGKPRILVFDKINGFFHAEAVPAARAAFTAMAERKGWAIAVTDKGGVFNPATLKQFDTVIWNNNSGDVLTLAQRKALKAFVEGGGGVVAIHGAGGDSAHFWDWYVDDLLGARFNAHPMAPQFQEARVAVSNAAHPIAKGLPAEWRMTDEWYSFKNNPRASGANVILTLDEATYKPVGPMNSDLRMGSDHPIAWTKCIGKGRAFYSAIGHRAESYAQPQHLTLLEAAIGWA